MDFGLEIVGKKMGINRVMDLSAHSRPSRTVAHNG